jgi:Amidohydrolase family
MDREMYRFAFAARRTTPLAITHITVVPMDTERLLFDQTVVIEDGHITTVVPSSAIEPADIQGAQVVDGSGKYVMPGLADMHVHYWAPGDFAMFLANGVTVVRNMSGAPFHLTLQQKVRQGELPGPHIVTTGPIVEGAGPVPPTWRIVTQPEEAERLVHQCAERGYQQIKVYNRLTPASLRALGQAAASTGLRLTGHCPNTMTFEEAIAAGMTCFEHLTGIWRGHFKSGREPPSGRHNLDIDVVRSAADDLDFDAMRRLAHQMAAMQVWNCPTLVAMQFMYEAQPVASDHPLLKPLLRYVPQMALHVWEQLDPRYARGDAFQRWLDAMHARNRTFSRIVAILHEAGAPLLLGTDTPVRFVIPGFSVYQELANLVAAGLRPYDALRCATSDAARFLNQSDVWGTVTVGKRADLVLTRANPLEDVRALCGLDTVCVNGFYLARADLDTLLAQQEHVASLQVPLSLPTLDLASDSGEGHTAGHGTWIERINGVEAGRVTYRHRVLPDGDWIIEERYAFERGDIFDIGGARRRSVRLRLSSQFTIRHAEYLEQSFAGDERCEITWSEAGTYTIRLIDVDGYETLFTLGDHMVLPGARLALTVMPVILAQELGAGEGRAASALHVDAAGARVLPIKLSAVTSAGQSGSAPERQWRITVDYAGESIEQTYCLACGGRFLSMEEGWRELVPASMA